MFLRDRTLMAQPFTRPKLQFEGDPFPVAEQVTDFSVAANGTLAYSSGGDDYRNWFCATGAAGN